MLEFVSQMRACDSYKYTKPDRPTRPEAASTAHEYVHVLGAWDAHILGHAHTQHTVHTRTLQYTDWHAHRLLHDLPTFYTDRRPDLWGGCKRVQEFELFTRPDAACSVLIPDTMWIFTAYLRLYQGVRASIPSCCRLTSNKNAHGHATHRRQYMAGSCPWCCCPCCLPATWWRLAQPHTQDEAHEQCGIRLVLCRWHTSVESPHAAPHKPSARPHPQPQEQHSTAP